MARRGMGAGRGKGYRNIAGGDPRIHSQSAKGMKQPQSIPITLTRVPYGSSKTPVHLREYRMGSGLPVGTIKEYQDLFDNQKKNVKLNVPLTFKEKMEVTTKSKLRDSDKDGVGDVLDCQPLNPKKQDDKLKSAKTNEDIKTIKEFGTLVEEVTTSDLQGIAMGESLKLLDINMKEIRKDETKRQALREAEDVLLGYAYGNITLKEAQVSIQTLRDILSKRKGDL